MDSSVCLPPKLKPGTVELASKRLLFSTLHNKAGLPDSLTRSSQQLYEESRILARASGSCCTSSVATDIQSYFEPLNHGLEQPGSHRLTPDVSVWPSKPTYLLFYTPWPTTGHQAEVTVVNVCCIVLE